MSGENTNNAVSAESTAESRVHEGENASSSPCTRERQNRRDRFAHESSYRTRYRRTTVGLTVLGFVAAAAGVVFPDARQVLFVLAGTGLFGGVLAHTLLQGRPVDAMVVDRISASVTENQRIVADELGTGADPVYVPSDGTVPARLRLTGVIGSNRAGPITGEDGHELTFEPTAGRLFLEFERLLTNELATDPEPLTAQLASGLVDVFELADAVEPHEIGQSSVTVAVSGSALGDIDRFDHPIASFLAVGYTFALDRPVRIEVSPGAGDLEQYVTCRWGSP